jgi:predicted transcriptional regulator of viral defense system
MRALALLKALEEYPVFDTATFKALTGAKAQYAWLQLYRLKAAGHIFEVQRGKYSVHKDPFLIASRIVWPSYISLWSALRYWNLTLQLPAAVWVITPRRGRKLRYRNTTIIFIHTKPAQLFGYKKVLWRGFEVFIAEPEKAIIDSLLFRKVPLVEIADALKAHLRKLSKRRLVRYAIMTKNAALIKRLGYLLEGVGASYYSELKRYIYSVWTALDWAAPKKGKQNKRWRIIVNVS